MADMKIFAYLRKGCIPIVILSLVFGYLFSGYIGGKQTYTASVIIEYTNSLAPSGLTPSGAAIDVKQIYASNVIADAIRELDLNTSIDFVRSRINVKEIIPDDEQTRINALLERGEEYEYFPTAYTVTFTVGSAYSAEFARRVLEAVIRNYILFYGEKYVDVTLTPNNVGNTDDKRLDYIESIEMIQAGLEDIITFLYARSDAYPTFYCSQSGLSFGNLLDEYLELRDLNVYRLYSLILDNALSRDPDALLQKYGYRLDSAYILADSYESKIAAIEPLIQSYSEKSVEAKSVGSVDGENNEYLVSSFVSGANHSQTTYDSLMDSYIEYKTALRLNDLEIDRLTEMKDVFTRSADAGMNTEQLRSLVEREIPEITEKSNALYGTLVTMIGEFNEYLSTMNITTRSTISVALGVNTSLYTLIALAFFFVVGAIGTIVLSRLAEIARYHKYVDPKTNLPNRAGCDIEIDRLDKRPLNDSVCCAYVTLTNLNNVNTREGRERGDVILKNFGVILKHCASKYGFAGYNGGPSFICVFENCRLERAAGFEQALIETCENYNSRYPDSRIDVRVSMAESGREGVYSIRELIRRAISYTNADRGSSK